MIIEILLALFLVLVLRLLDGWVERRRDVLHYVTKPSRGARDNAGRLERELVSTPSRLALKLREAPPEHRRATSRSRASLILNPSGSPLSASISISPSPRAARQPMRIPAWPLAVRLGWIPVPGPIR
jgi:hypothetical protein